VRDDPGLAPPPSARFAVGHLPRFAGEERGCSTLLLTRKAEEVDRRAARGSRRRGRKAARLSVISVIVTATDDAKALSRLLTALVPAAAEGLVREVAVIGAEGPSTALAEDAGADLFEHFGAAAARARGPWLAGLPLAALFAPDWIEILAGHLAWEPPTPARLVARPDGFSLARAPEGWLAPKRLAPSAGLAEQDFQRLARRSGRRLRVLGRR
jgi:hypothetical protein